jgi:hypothetical protein
MVYNQGSTAREERDLIEIPPGIHPYLPMPDTVSRKKVWASGPGRVFGSDRWQVLHHVVLHGMQHHAEIAAQLTSQGLSPGDIDFVFYALGR